MREILFKAKRIDNGEWAEGYLFDDGFENGRMFVGGLVIEEYKGTACDEWDITGIDFYEVDPSTICQYTGLVDKNGQKIWENDVVYMRCNGLSGYGKVIYENGCFWIDDKKRGRKYPFSNHDVKYRVDGNIFDEGSENIGKGAEEN